MSYLQIEIGGKLRGWKVNQLAVEIWSHHMPFDLVLVDSAMLYAVVYGGLRGNSVVKNEDPDYTFEKVTEWVDEMPKVKRKELSQQLQELFAESNSYKEWLEDYKERLHAVLQEAQPKNEGKPKKKARKPRSSSGSRSTSSPLES